MVLGIILFLQIRAAFLLYAMVMGFGDGSEGPVLLAVLVNAIFLLMIVVGAYLIAKGGVEERAEWRRMAANSCPVCRAMLAPGQNFFAWCGSRLVQVSDVTMREPENR